MKFITKAVCLLCLLGSTGLHAAPQCLVYLSQATRGTFQGQVLKPMNGILIELSPRESVFALGPYFGGSHQGLLFNLKSKYRINKASVLWAGEVLVSIQNQRPVVHQTNERAESLVGHRLRAGGFAEGENYDSALDIFSFERNDIRALQRFFKSGAIQVVKDYQHLTRSALSQTIVPLSENSPITGMFEFRTEITHLIMNLHTVVNGGPLVGTEDRLKSALQALESYLQDYLLYAPIESSLAVEKTEAALALIQEVLGMNAEISKLNKGLLRTLYENVLFVSNQTLQTVNPGIAFDYKVRR